MISFFLFFFALIDPADAQLSSQAGQVLLESYRCDSTNGTATQSVRDSLRNLRQAADKIFDQQRECAIELSGLARLPEIDGILTQIDSYGESEAIKEQEKIIDEALSDIAMRKQITPEDAALYPPQSALQQIVVTARQELIRLRAHAGIARARATREQYLTGVQQLDGIGTELALVLRKNSDCLNRNPILRRQVVAGLIGIAGFFAASPLGIGISLAGRVLQNIFDISDAKQSSPGIMFETSHQALLVSGLSCTLENLSKQHCNLVRQKSLLAELSGEQCKNCSPVMKKEFNEAMNLVRKGQTAKDAVDTVTGWLGSSIRTAAGQAISQKIRGGFTSATAELQSELSEARGKARSAELSSVPDAVKKNMAKAIFSAVRDYGAQLFGSSNGFVVVQQNSPELQTQFSEDERRYNFVRLIFNEKEFLDLVDSFRTEIQNSKIKRQKYGVDNLSGGQGNTTMEVAVQRALFEYFGAEDITQFPPAKAIQERLSSDVAFDRISARISSYQLVVQKTVDLPEDEQLSRFFLNFMDQPLGTPSTLQNVENIHSFFKSIPPEFSKSRGGLLRIPELKGEVDAIVKLGQRLRESDQEVTKNDSTELYTRVTKLLDPDRVFRERVAAIAGSVQNYQAQKLAKFVSNPDDLGTLIFLETQDFTRQVFSLKNPYTQSIDLKSGALLSATQLDSFSKFFKPYSKNAFLLLNKKDSKEKNLAAGLAENVDPKLKDHFCIQALGLTDLSDVTKECEDAKIEMNGVVVKFKDYRDGSLDKRTCAYTNFLNQIDYKRAAGKAANPGAN